MTLLRRQLLRISALGGVVTLANAACGTQAPPVAATAPPAPTSTPPAAAKPTVAPAVVATSAAAPAATPATPTGSSQPLSPANGAPKRGGVIRAPGSQLVHLDTTISQVG